MADIVISNQMVIEPRQSRPLPLWVDWYDSQGLLDVDITGQLSGSVKVGGTALADAIVTLYYRRNGNLIVRTRTDTAGDWTVANLDKSVADYYAIAQTESDYNALVYDKLTPL